MKVHFTLFRCNETLIPWISQIWFWTWTKTKYKNHKKKNAITCV